MRKVIILLSLISVSLSIKAQNDAAQTDKYYKLPLQISFGNQCVGLAYQNLFSAFNPSLSVGTEIGYNKRIKHRISQTASIGFFANDVIGNTVSLSTDFCYRYNHKSGVFADISLGLGLLNQFHPRDIYEYNSTTGEYDKVKDFGKLAALLENGLSLGYDLSKTTKYPISIFVKHNFFIQSPYFDIKSFPIMPQSITQIGLKINIKKNEK